MKILRRTAYVLLTLLILGWCVGWFAGQWLLKRELGNSLMAGDLGDQVRYEVSDFSIGGFPFSYTIKMNDTQISQRGNASPLLQLDDQFSVQVSLLDTLWNAVTGKPIGAHLNLSGTYQFGSELTLTLDSAWMTTGVANLTALGGDLSNLIFAGVDFDMRGLSLAASGQPVLFIERVSLDMDLLKDHPGYAFDFILRGIEPETPLFAQAPNRLDGVYASGRLQPDLQAGYGELLSDLQRNPIEALVTHGSLIAAFVSSAPGFYLEQGTLVWGDAQLQASLDIPLNIQISLKPRATLGLEGKVTGTNMGQRLQGLLREPSVQSSELALLINGLLIGARSVGLDLDTGTPSTIHGTLLEISRTGIEPFPEDLQINGQSLLIP